MGNLIPEGFVVQTGTVLGDSQLDLHCPMCRVDIPISTDECVTNLQWVVDSATGMDVILTLKVDHVCAPGTVITAVPG